ncbi:MAG: hypothetical protein ACREJ5_11285 [Geminicoccaceae bacterium]
MSAEARWRGTATRSGESALHRDSARLAPAARVMAAASRLATGDQVSQRRPGEVRGDALGAAAGPEHRHASRLAAGRVDVAGLGQNRLAVVS